MDGFDPYKVNLSYNQTVHRYKVQELVSSEWGLVLCAQNLMGTNTHPICEVFFYTPIT